MVFQESQIIIIVYAFILISGKRRSRFKENRIELEYRVKWINNIVIVMLEIVAYLSIIFIFLFIYLIIYSFISDIYTG